MREIRCPECGKLLLKAKGQGEVKCNRCKSIISYDTERASIKATKN